ncbi:MAG: hypothetical protein AB7K36_07365 [Chloroflexota bacterium]
MLTRRSPAIDFASLPLEDATRLLRDLGLEVLRRALLGRASGSRPVLADLLPAAQARRLAPRREGRLAPVSYRVTLGQALGQGISLRAWRSRVWGQLRERLGRGSLGYVPDFLWPTVAERAWRSPEFQRQAALLARSILQEQYIFPPGGLPVPMLAPQTYWTLLLLAEARPTPAIWLHLRELFRLETLRSGRRLGGEVAAIGRALWARIPSSTWTWLPTSKSRRFRAARYLGQQASVQVLATEHWAGFWDQYVIGESIIHWHGARPSLHPLVRAALADLPVVAEMLRRVFSHRSDAQRAQASAPSSLAHPEWARDRPAWLASQYDPHERIGG